MFFFEFNTDPGEGGVKYRVEVVEEKKCYICFSYFVKICKEMENGVIVTLDTVHISPEAYTTLQIYHKHGHSEKAKKYINRFIFDKISFLVEQKLTADAEERDSDDNSV
jgi:propanediol utilization protein